MVRTSVLLDDAVVGALGGSRSESVDAATAFAGRLIELLEHDAPPAIAEDA